MYQTHTSLVLGFHGCEKSIGEQLLSGEKDFKASDNEYDWLGNGMYFWENSHSRAFDFAKEVNENPGMGNIKEPYVIGAILDLGRCLNLLDYQNLLVVKAHHDMMVELRTMEGKEIPKNILGPDKVKRFLDCAVIQYTHELVEMDAKVPAFDSVRAMFKEGGPLYDQAGFNGKNHIQIAIRNPNCIKGFFLPRQKSPEHPHV